MSDLEKREIQFSSVQDRGHSLIVQSHPACKTVEAYMSAMQNQWSWLLQLTLCLEAHLKNLINSGTFFNQVNESEQWILEKNKALNISFSQSDFTLDQGELLLEGMHALREEINEYSEHIYNLVKMAEKVVPIKQRKKKITHPIEITCICVYDQINVSFYEVT